MAVSINEGVLVVGVLIRRALLFGPCRNPEPYRSKGQNFMFRSGGVEDKLRTAEYIIQNCEGQDFGNDPFVSEQSCDPL